jgi:molecular chaperone DnaJ
LRDLYEIMGLPRNASDEDIRKRYRELARQYHPDVNPGNQEAVEKFKEISMAFEVLSDSNARSEYDMFGGTRRGGPFAQGKPFSSAFEDMFSSFFGEQRRQIRKGENIVVEVPVTFQQILKGDEIDVKFNRRSLCNQCKGLGGNETTCSHCNGTGAKVIFGRAMTVKTSCHACNATGKIIGDTCTHCNAGYCGHNEETTRFPVMPGVEHGMRFIQKGLGEPCAHPDGISGDLILIINTPNVTFFERQPRGDVLVNWPLSYSELVLGTEIEVPTLEGRALVKIPPGTVPETKFRLKQMGFPIFDPRNTIYQRGDQYVNVKLDLPQVVEEDYKHIFEKLSDLEKNRLLNIRKEIIDQLGEQHGKSQE